jgi:predicted PurR-regulated permease PerM
MTLELLAEFKKVSFSVIVATVITSGVQAVAALVGYFISRVPHPLCFAAVTFLVAFVPPSVLAASAAPAQTVREEARLA